MTPRIVAVTPAGRRAYLEILKAYILRDETIERWDLWDNCRAQADRTYIRELANVHDKIRIVDAPSVDGSNGSINQFYRCASDRSTFYIKMDDDVLYLPDRFGAALHGAASAERGKYTYWSPLVVNNAICSWLLKYHSGIKIDANVSASSGCVHGWRSWRFAEALHRSFIEMLKVGNLAAFHVPNFDISLARFSINCIGFFGEDVATLGDAFCPLGVDDEEWISAVLPSLTGKPGRIIGNLIVSHFSFFTQEEDLLRTGLLQNYADLAGAPVLQLPATRARSLRGKVRRMLEKRLFSGSQAYTIAPREAGCPQPTRAFSVAGGSQCLS